MAVGKTDWKKESQKLQTGPSLPSNPKDIRVLLQPGTRKSVGNEGLPNEDVMQILEQMQGNLTWRGHNASAEMKKRVEEAKKRRPKTIDIRTRAQKLKGLFGGGR